MNVNLRGVMLSYKHAALQMIKQGRVEVDASLAGFWQHSGSAAIHQRIKIGASSLAGKQG